MAANRAAAARLRLLLSARPQDAVALAATQEAVKELQPRLHHVIDGDAASTPSLLLLATTAGDMPTFRTLYMSGARAAAGEDVYAAAAECVRDASNDVADAVVRTLLDLSVPMIASNAPNPATLMCEQRGLAYCLNQITPCDPWGIHALQSLPRLKGCELHAKREAEELSVFVQRGDSVVVAVAVNKLKFQARAAHNAEHIIDSVIARMSMHAAIEAHDAAGTLNTIVHAAAATHRPGCGSALFELVVRVADVDLISRFVRAGAHRSDSCVFYLLSTRASGDDIGMSTPIDASGAPVLDDRMPLYLQQMYDGGMRAWASSLVAAYASCVFAKIGFTNCLRLMIYVVDPHVQAAGLNGCILLHCAAAQGAAATCAYLMEAGFDATVPDHDGVTPLGQVLMSRNASAEAMVEAITAFTKGSSDVRTVLRECGAWRHVARKDLYIGVSDRRRLLSSTAVTLHVLAAGRAYRAAPRHALASVSFEEVRGMYLLLYRTLALDAYSSDGVYVPDQLRAGTQEMDSVKLAVQVDVWDEIQAYAFSGQRVFQHPLAFWQASTMFQRPSGVSRTVQAWAHMRRLQAVWRRRVRLAAQ